MRMTSVVCVTLFVVVAVGVVTVAADDAVSESREESDFWLTLSAAGWDPRDESSSSARLGTVDTDVDVDDWPPLLPTEPQINQMIDWLIDQLVRFHFRFLA